MIAKLSKSNKKNKSLASTELEHYLNHCPTLTDFNLKSARDKLSKSELEMLIEFENEQQKLKE